MLQDFSSVTLREARPSVVATERLTLRRPTLADVRTISQLANDRRVAENTRRLPHPYSHDDAVDFIRATSELGSETVFLIEHDSGPVGMVGIDCSTPGNAELGYWLGVEHWGRGFATEARAARSTSSSRSSRTSISMPARASPTRLRATCWRSAASSGAASSCTASWRWAPPRRSTASASRAACGRR